MWKSLVVGTLKKQAFSQLSNDEYSTNAKTRHLVYGRLQKSPYINLLGPQVVCVLFRAKLQTFDLKTNFKKKYTCYRAAHFVELNQKPLILCPSVLMDFTVQSLKDVTLQNLANTNDIDNLKKKLFFFILKYQKYRDVYE